jgi:hypothetical protein
MIERTGGTKELTKQRVAKEFDPQVLWFVEGIIQPSSDVVIKEGEEPLRGVCADPSRGTTPSNPQCNGDLQRT